ncbi:transcription elongation factor, GreA/GreB, family protein [Chlamydia ibidis]|uniref:Transcription elongation factor GreA n=2 Tax=Chlamydia ibidis TaxID=1405396 RepID=S7J302_9CHLA|nr:GreA/GreB family elongation factor [Chlamydia ibidis]EPP34608.1 transcription elongation factor, GreA/GreB, family protein [Chlamydia ibidis]EQM63178.1 transcription elongation factor [Chlamydia ibidis 10-1398/6]
MDYLEKLQVLIDEEQPSSFFSLWEEYCFNDVVRSDELILILEKVKHSSLAPLFGKIADSVLPLWEAIPEGREKDKVLQLVLDLQTSNTKQFYDVAIDYVNRRYRGRENFNEALRVVGLREGCEFQYSLSRFDFLMHLREGNFVFHSGGWGVGEVMGVSFLQQKVLIEFEGVMTPKDISFETAFKSLVPLDNDHFLSRRFGDPDSFEVYAKENPVGVIECLLKDLGPKTAKEIKDELVDLVIPEVDWNRWWQAAKTKLKKSTHITSPKTIKDAYVFHVEGDSLISRLKSGISNAQTVSDQLVQIYQFIRDLHSELKDLENRKTVVQALKDLTVNDDIALEIQRDLLLSEFLGEKGISVEKEYISSLSEEQILQIVNNISIVALQKSFLILVRNNSPVWEEVFTNILLSTTSPTLREVVFKVLKSDSVICKKIKDKLLECAQHPMMYPELFTWFFLKIGSNEDGLFDSNDRVIKRLFLEGALVFMHDVASTTHKDLGKKIYSFLVGQRYLPIRQMIEGAPISYLQEFILLSTKCPQFSSSDLSVLQSLAEVVQPDMKKHHLVEEEDVLWTTPESFSRMKAKLASLAGKEMVDNAKEIEDARALGDLRENSEYKFALEKRARLQEEIRVLSEEVNRARILTKDVIYTDKVGVGCKVSLQDEDGVVLVYTILGPWDADPENNVLSLKSKLAQEMLGKSIGDSLHFQGKKYTVSQIQAIWE